MAELRELIAQRLIGDGSLPWADRVVETGAVTVDLAVPPFGELPFIVVRQIQTVVDLNRVPTEAFDVWVHAPALSFAVLDVLERLVVSLLDRAILVDLDRQHNFALQYAGTLQGDQIIDPWDAYARAIRFSTLANALGGPLAPDDPRAAFLRAHIASLFCDPPECFQLDPLTWMPTDACPGLYVKPVISPVEVQRYNAFTLFRETLGIHVVAATFAAQNDWVDRIALQLPGDALYVEPDKIDGGRKVPPRRSTMLLRLVGQDLTVNPLVTAQLRVEVQFSELACGFPEFAPPLTEAVAKLPENVTVTVTRQSRTIPQIGRRT